MGNARNKVSQQVAVVFTLIVTFIATIVLAIVSWFVAKKSTDKRDEYLEKRDDKKNNL